MREEILLVGGGGHCKSVIDVIECEGRYTIAGIIDKKELIGTQVLDYEVIGCDDQLGELFQRYKNAIVTIGQIGSSDIRVKLFELLKNIGYNMPMIKSPFAYISKHASVGEGSVVMHYAIVNADAKVAENCIINTRALVEHDSTIGEHCHISTGAIINGGVTVEAHTFVGSNTTSKEYSRLHGFIKAGGVVK